MLIRRTEGERKAYFQGYRAGLEQARQVVQGRLDAHDGYSDVRFPHTMSQLRGLLGTFAASSVLCEPGHYGSTRPD